MAKEKKKIQLRRCLACQKVGHNRATCPAERAALRKASAASPATKQKTARAPLHFFVHHVSSAPSHSPHVVNLRAKRDNVWQQVEGVAPETNQTLYHSYHQTQPASETIPTRPTEENITLPKAQLAVPAEKFSWFKKISQQLQTWQASRTIDQSIFKMKAVPVAEPATAEPFVARPTVRLKTREPITWPTDLWQTLTTLLPKERAIAAILIAVVTFVLPGRALSYYQSMVLAKDTIVKNSSEAFLALQDSTTALKQADLGAAANATETALQKFNTVLAILDDNRILETAASLLPGVGGSLESREKIVLAGHEIALGNSYILQGLQENAAVSTTFTNRLSSMLNTVHLALPNYELAAANLQEVDNSALPLEYQSQFNDFKKIFTGLVADFKTLDELGNSLLEIFGGEGSRRYVLVFQNPHELRASGGFMGSFATLEIKNGEITKLDVPAGGTYDLQGSLKKFVEPPTPLLLTNKRWEFQDANWFPDFPTTAEKILWFYRNSYGVTADGVIAINSTVLERLLSILGPITDNKRNVTLEAASAVPVLQQIVEEGPEKKLNKPKQIIADLAPTLIDEVKNAGSKAILPLLTNLQEALEQKEIQVYFQDDETEETIKRLGWTGHLVPTTDNQDYLLVVNSNIRGQKSDAKIEQTVSHQAIVAEDGSVTDTVVITRKHTGNNGEKLYGQTNIDYLRVYVPEGSELLSASGFTWPDEKIFRAPEEWYAKDSLLQEVEQEQSVDALSGTRVTKELGKTAFGNWIITEPGATSRVQFTYRLPFTMKPEEQATGLKKLLSEKSNVANYQLISQKQSGSDSQFDSQIIFPAGWQAFWNDGSHMTLATNGARIAPHGLTKDSVWSLLMQQH